MTNSIREIRNSLMIAIISNDRESVNAIIQDAITRENVRGSADEYHNLSTELARLGEYGLACSILDKGLKQHPMDADLLADFLQYGIKSERLEDCKAYFTTLNGLDRVLWTWRSFDFSIDYLLYLYGIAVGESAVDVRSALQTQLREIVQEFQKYLPYDETAWLAAYNIFSAFGEQDNAIMSLLDGINGDRVAPKCCIKYADIQLERGKYAETVKYAQRGIRASAQDQESVSVGYLYYISALAKEALLRTDDGLKQENLVDDVSSIFRDYKVAYSILESDKKTYRTIIKRRVTMLEIESGQNSGIDFKTQVDDSDSDES